MKVVDKQSVVWDWTYAQLHYLTPPKCACCKKPVKFGYLGLLKRYEGEKEMYCEGCAHGQ